VQHTLPWATMDVRAALELYRELAEAGRQAWLQAHALKCQTTGRAAAVASQLCRMYHLGVTTLTYASFSEFLRSQPQHEKCTLPCSLCW
jgi:hypothetical protein